MINTRLASYKVDNISKAFVGRRGAAIYIA